MTSTLLIVMAHNGTEGACRRHLPYWQAVSTELVFFSPCNSVAQMVDHPGWTFGRAGHHDGGANQRFLAALKLAQATKYDRFILTEYDAPIFGPLPEYPADDTLAGNVFRDCRKNSGFVGTTFIHPPFFFSRSVLNGLIEELGTLNHQESYFYDRWLGLACERLCLPLLNLMGTGAGYSQNTIVDRFLPEAIEAVSHGAVAIHGCKTGACFAELERAHKQYVATKAV